MRLPFLKFALVFRSRYFAFCKIIVSGVTKQRLGNKVLDIESETPRILLENPPEIASEFSPGFFKKNLSETHSEILAGMTSGIVLKFSLKFDKELF